MSHVALYFIDLHEAPHMSHVFSVKQGARLDPILLHPRTKVRDT